MGLTDRQRELMVYIQTRSLCPSYREMGKALGLSETNLTAPVHALLSALEGKGYIRRLRDRARAIEVLRPVPVRYRFLTLEQAKAEAERRFG